VPDIDFDRRPGVEPERSGALDGPDLQELLGRDDVAAKLLASRRAFQLTQLLERIDAHVRIRADAKRNPSRAQPLHRDEPVAEVGLRRRADADPRTGVPNEIQLVVARVGCVDDRRPRPEAAGALEQLDGPDAVLRETLLDLAGLLVRVDVEDEILSACVRADLLEPVGRARANGVRGNPDSHPFLPELRDLLEVGADGLLPEAIDAASGVGDVQEHELDARSAGGLRSCLRLLEADVVELTDGRVTGSTHLTEGARVSVADRLRRESSRFLEHGVAPVPEVVPLGSSPHRPLERMAVRVDETLERQPVRHGREATIPPEMATRAVSTPLAQLPNVLTVARLAIIPIFVAVVIQAGGEASWAAGILFGVAGITDQVDGWLARRWHVESQFGRFVDPLADRIIIDAAVILLWYYDRLPWPALALILVRDGILVVATPAAIRRGYEFSVSFLGKAATWVLYASIAFILVTDPGTDWPLALFWAGVGLAVAAGILYAMSAWRTTR
jgi:CDP-diacylglycerol--glycerol-3-phosphate 3-phosphatidyltransferase